jgi:hypothetical protein
VTPHLRAQVWWNRPAGRGAARTCRRARRGSAIVQDPGVVKPSPFEFGGCAERQITGEQLEEYAQARGTIASSEAGDTIDAADDAWMPCHHPCAAVASSGRARVRVYIITVWKHRNNVRGGGTAMVNYR